MSIDKLIGREYECRRLDCCMSEDRAQLITVSGRLRVGKTYLIDRYFNRRFDFKITGYEKQPKDIQLQNFANELSRQTRTEQKVPENWMKAFEMLRSYLESLPSDEKAVVFFDEMPWMDTPRSGFLPAFEGFWNSWGYAQDNLVFIVCGSATSWIIDHIDGNKGGLFNRKTTGLFLNPFTLKDTEEYLKRIKGIEWNRLDIAELYMILGGMPYYLSLLDPELSYRQNIDELFFRKRAELSDEFSRLYRALFSNSDQYIKLVEALSTKRIGLTRTEIEKLTGLPKNGDLTRMLENLINSGFVDISNYYGNKKQHNMYRLSDYFTQFYLRFVKDYSGRDEHFWSNTLDNPSVRAWAGLTFEQLCKDHIPQIKKKLGIAGVLSEESSWFRKADSDNAAENSGAQIDLLIDRRDRVINICESKFSINEFTIDKEYDSKLRNKIDAFRQDTKTNKILQLTMITTLGVKQGKYSSIAGSQVTLDDLFE
jgi:AAA+ ATPase superfamily predicted ATPase